MHDAEAGAERDCPGDSVQPGGPDGSGEALPGGHPPGAGLDDLAGGPRRGGRVISKAG
jgi:hypothetical protein